MKRLLITGLFFGTCLLSAMGQSREGRSIGDLLRGTQKGENGFQLPQSERGSGVVRSYVENKELRTSDRWTADTLYYREAKRVNGWLEGTGKPLHKTELTAGAPYYRFTRHTPAGHYLRVEYIGDGTCPEIMQIAMLSNAKKYDYYHEDTTGFSELMKREGAIRCLDFTPSADGKRVLVEKATDKDGTFCHQLSLETIADNKAVGFYTVGNGRLLRLTDKRYEGATGAIFEYSEDGSVKTITPIDANGWPIARLYEE